MKWNFRSLCILFLLFAVCCAAENLHFEDILKKYRESHASLEANRQSQKTLMLVAKQTGSFNPLNIGLETNVLGDNELSVSLNQSFELGRKTKKSKALLSENNILEADAVSIRRHLEYDISLLYIQLSILENRLTLMDSITEINQKLVDWMQYAVKQGVASEINVLRLKLEVNEREMERQELIRKQEKLVQVLNHLTSLNLKTTDKFFLSFTYLRGLKPDTIDVGKTLLFEKNKLELRSSQLHVDAVPPPWVNELQLEGTYRHKGESEKDGELSVGINIPINFKGNTDKKLAQSQQRRMKAEAEALIMKNQEELLEIKFDLKVTGEKITHLETEIIPASKKIMQETQNNFKKGLMSYLDFRESQTSYLEFENYRLSLMQELAGKWAEVNLYTVEKYYALQ